MLSSCSASRRKAGSSERPIGGSDAPACRTSECPMERSDAPALRRSEPTYRPMERGGAPALLHGACSAATRRLVAQAEDLFPRAKDRALSGDQKRNDLSLLGAKQAPGTAPLPERAKRVIWEGRAARRPQAEYGPGVGIIPSFSRLISDKGPRGWALSPFYLTASPAGYGQRRASHSRSAPPSGSPAGGDRGASPSARR
jgi:hypothetical protein